MKLELRDKLDNSDLYNLWDVTNNEHTCFFVAFNKNNVEIISQNYKTIAIADTIEALFALYEHESRVKIVQQDNPIVCPPKHKPEMWQ